MSDGFVSTDNLLGARPVGPRGFSKIWNLGPRLDPVTAPSGIDVSPCSTVGYSAFAAKWRATRAARQDYSKKPRKNAMPRQSQAVLSPVQH